MNVLKKIGSVLLSILCSDAFMRSFFLLAAFTLFVLTPLRDAVTSCVVIFFVMLCVPTIKREKGPIRCITLVVVLIAFGYIVWTLYDAIISMYQ